MYLSLPKLIKADADADADFLIKRFVTILLPTPTPILKKKGFAWTPFFLVWSKPTPTPTPIRSFFLYFFYDTFLSVGVGVGIGTSVEYLLYEIFVEGKMIEHE